MTSERFREVSSCCLAETTVHYKELECIKCGQPTTISYIVPAAQLSDMDNERAKLMEQNEMLAPTAEYIGKFEKIMYDFITLADTIKKRTIRNSK